MTEAQLYLEIAIWSQVLSSVLFIAVLVYMWFRWLMPVFLAAQARSNEQIREAERHRDEVKGALEALHEDIRTARHDAELIERRASDRAERERQTTLRDAADAGERAVRDAGRELERARSAARLRLRGELLERALRVARTDANQRVSPELDARLVDDFVNSLEQAASG